MKQMIKKTLLGLMVFALFVASMPIISAKAAVSLNTKSKELYVGESFTLKVSGTGEKAKFSSTKKSVASVNKNGKVTAKKSGKATIKAKVANKTLKCSVTVKDKFSSTAATKNVSVELLDTGKGVVAILENDSKWNLNVSATLVYKKQGGVLGTSNDYNYVFEKGSRCALFFDAPLDENYRNIDYDDYKISLSIEEASSSTISKTAKIKTSASLGTKGLVVETENVSGTELYSIKIAAVFYDQDGKVIGYDYGYAECKSNGSVDYVELTYPYDDSYKYIIPDDYEVFVNGAYNYDWMM